MTMHSPYRMSLTKICSLRRVLVLLYAVMMVFLITILQNYSNQTCTKNCDSFILLYNLSSISSGKTYPFAISSNALGDPSTGRLGNRMFMLASIYGIGRRLGAYGILGCSFCSKLDIILKEFRIGAAVETRSKLDGSGFCNMEIDLQEEKSYVYMNFSDYLARNEMKNLDLFIINGNLQSWKYFHQYRSEIVNDIFQFRSSIVKEAEEQFRTILHGNSDKSAHFSCIHARRGDFLDTQTQHLGFRAANYTTIQSAIEYLNKSLSDKYLHFLLFSDDPGWCLEHFGHCNFLTVIRRQSPAVTMQMMREYCHSIFITASLSTFGWWAAYLNSNAHIFYNAVPAIPGSTVDTMMINKETYFLPEWTPVYL